MTDLGANLSFLSILVYFIWNILYIGYLGKFVSYWAVLNPEIMKLHWVIVTEQFYTIFEVYEVCMLSTHLQATTYKVQGNDVGAVLWKLNWDLHMGGRGIEDEGAHDPSPPFSPHQATRISGKTED